MFSLQLFQYYSEGTVIFYSFDKLKKEIARWNPVLYASCFADICLVYQLSIALIDETCIGRFDFV